MDYLYQKDGHEHLIIFVHGFNGGEKTWQGNKQRFLEVLKSTDLVKHYFDIASYTYQTRLFELNTLAKLQALILGFFRNRPKEDLKGFNVRVNDISRPLEGEIRQLVNRYQSISIIAHSMGGLVAKNALSWLTDMHQSTPKVKLFICLSVPHLGTNLADFASNWSDLFGDNPQVIDLKAMGTFTTDLTQRYSRLTPQPRMICQWGYLDIVVPQAAALPAGVTPNDIVHTEDDHFSVLLVKDVKNNNVLTKILGTLRQVLAPVRSVQVDIASGMKFGQLVTILASRWEIQVDKSCFSAEELASLLKTGQLSGDSPEESIANVKSFCESTFPSYSVKWIMGTNNYTIRKK